MRSTKFRKWKGAIAERAEFCGHAGFSSLAISLHLLAHQIFPRLPLPDHRELVATNERFRPKRTRIVVRRHHKPVRARAHDCEQIAFAQFGHVAAERKKSPDSHTGPTMSISLIFLSLSVLGCCRGTISW